MFKKIIATVALVFVLPLLANAASYTMTASVTSGNGTASPASLTRVGGLQNPAPFFDFAPGTGFHVESISGLPAPVVPLTPAYTLKNKITGATVTLPALAGVTVRVAITNLAVPVALGGVFTNTNPVANAGVGQVVFPGTVTLNGLASIGATSYAWTQTSGPTVALTPAGLGKVTFNGVTLGSYNFLLRINGGSTSTTFVTVTNSAAAVARTSCNGCHSLAGVGQRQNQNVFNQWSSSVHKTNLAMCFDCHVGTNTGGHPGRATSIQCTTCHGDFGIVPTDYVSSCADCHVGTTVHGAQVATAPAPGGNRTSCIDCHAAALQHPGTFVKDNNNGVRAITAEFGKWSHHVTGVTLQDAHCAACHLEGIVVNGAVVVNTKYHMADAQTHLRNADTDGDFAWDPATPNHTNMDNFCMSCHDANGATSPMSAAIQTLLNGSGPSPLNPFNDTISNQYDKMLRGRVVNVNDQFNTANYSHHAVKGQKYTGRTRVAGDPRAIASAANPAVFASFSGILTFNNTSSTQGMFDGERTTIYEAARFVSTYQTLSGPPSAPTDKTLGDDSVLHCGDCHTVGQWKAGSSVNVDGTPTVAVIGAHGSNNEYMLRVSNGADILHKGATYNYNPVNMLAGGTLPITTAPAGNFAGMTFGPFPTGLPHVPVNIANQVVPATDVPESQPFLVCYNCHVYSEYGSVYFSNTLQGGREGSHTFGDHTRGNYCNGPYNTSGSGRATTYTAVYGPQVTGATGTFQGVANFNFGRLQPGTAANLAGGTTAASAVWCSASTLNNLNLKTQGTAGSISEIIDMTTGSPATVDAACNSNGGATNPALTISPNATTRGSYQGMNGTSAGGGNIFQIQCNSCHNSGPANGFGGIHGSKLNTYVDAAGQTSNTRRFLPGLGNVRWVPGDLKGTEAQQWEQEANLNYTSGTNQAGCYTLNTGTTTPGYLRPLPAASEGGTTTGTGQLFGTWGSCTDHGSVDGLERTMKRPVSY